MSYPNNTPLNLSDRILVGTILKPKPRYTPSDEEINSNGSPSPPRQQTELLFPSTHRNSPGYLEHVLKYYENPSIPYYSRLDSIPRIPCMEGDPTRLSSSMIPCNFECGSHHLPTMRTSLPAVFNGSHYNHHPYYHVNGMKFLPHFQGYDSYFFPPYSRPKRVRTAFTPSQLLTLENAFEKNHYVVGTERKQLSQALGLSETQVKVWFQNRRTKHKRQKQDGQCCSQKNNGKDCLDSREQTSSSSEDDSDDETGSCKTSISSETDVGNTLLECKPSPVVSEDDEKSPKIMKNAIWNPIR